MPRNRSESEEWPPGLDAEGVKYLIARHSLEPLSDRLTEHWYALSERQRYAINLMMPHQRVVWSKKLYDAQP